MPNEQDVILESIYLFSTDLLCQTKPVSLDGVKYNSGECVFFLSMMMIIDLGTLTVQSFIMEEFICYVRVWK